MSHRPGLAQNLILVAAVLVCLLPYVPSRAQQGSAPRIQADPLLIPVTANCEFPRAVRCAEPTYATVTLTYEIPEPGMQALGGIGVSLGEVLGGRYPRNQRFGWGVLQSVAASSAQFVAARTSLFDVDAQTMMVGTPDGGTEVLALVSKALPAGEKIIVTLGDTTGGGPGLLVPGLPMRIAILVRENLLGPGSGFDYLDAKYGIEFPVIETHGHEVTRFAVTAPSEVRPGEVFDLKIRALSGPDAPQANALIVRNHAGAIAIEADPAGRRSPRSGGSGAQTALFSAADRGVLTRAMSLSQPGLHRITVTEDKARGGRTPGSGLSNPIRVGGGGEPTRTLWGILHLHTGRSGDGQGETEEAFRSARDDAGLDFVAVSDHCFTPGYKHGEVASMADRFDEPGRFAAFRAFEWTSRVEGHRHVVYPDSGTDTVPCEVLADGVTGVLLASSLDDLDRAAAQQGAVTILHHTLWAGRVRPITAFDFGDPLFPPLTQKLLEVYSAHGRSEYFDNRPYIMHGDGDQQIRPEDRPSSLQDALHLGFRLGVTAGTDYHLAAADVAVGMNFHTDNIRYSRQGLTAVLAREVTRQSIFEALHLRRTYGTTGARIRLRFSGNGHPMGSVVPSATVRLRIDVDGTAPLRRIVVLRDGREPLGEWQPKDVQSRACLIIRDDLRLSNPSSYYVRIEQTDDHMAWSSPIWYQPHRSRDRARPPIHFSAGRLPVPEAGPSSTVEEVECPQ